MPETHKVTIELNAKNGKISVDPKNLEVERGDKVKFKIVRKNNAAISCVLDFKPNSPFGKKVINENLKDGEMSFTKSVKKDAAVGNDDYDIILSYSEMFVLDPRIVVKKPPK